VDRDVQPFAEKCVTRFWEKLRDPSTDYKTNWNDLVSYRIFYTLPGKSSHAALIFSDDGINGFSIELAIRRTPERRLCLESEWCVKDAEWIPIPKVEINTSRYRLYLYAIEFMQQFGTYYDKKTHSCQDFILGFLGRLGIPKPFNTVMQNLKLALKSVPIVAMIFGLVGLIFALLERASAEEVGEDGWMQPTIGEEPELRAEEKEDELKANRKVASAFGIDVVILQGGR